MGKVSGKVSCTQRSTITKPPRKERTMFPWEFKYQHRLEDYFKASPRQPKISQSTASPSLVNQSADRTVSPKEGSSVVINSSTINETSGSRDCSGPNKVKETQYQHSKMLEEICGSNITCDGVESPSKPEDSVQPTEIPNSPARKQYPASSGKCDGDSLMQMQQSFVQLEVAVNPDMEQSGVVLKRIKYPVHYNLDDIFNYDFSPGKVSLKQRLVSE